MHPRTTHHDTTTGAIEIGAPVDPSAVAGSSASSPARLVGSLDASPAAGELAAALAHHGEAFADTLAAGRLLLQAQADPSSWAECRALLDLYACRRAGERAMRAARSELQRVTLGNLHHAVTRWAHEHRARFRPHSEGRPPGGWWGAWDDERGVVIVYAATWARVMRGWGLGNRQAARALRRLGALRVPQGAEGRDGRAAGTVWCEGRSVRAYAIELVVAEPGSGGATPAEQRSPLAPGTASGERRPTAPAPEPLEVGE